MCRIITAILLFNLLMCSCKTDSNKNNPQDIEVNCYHISIVKSYKEGKEVDVLEFEEAVEHLENMTGIKSEVNPSYLGLKAPSKKTLKNWINALKKIGVNCIS